ncbi:MAG TPA: tRNA (guanosine(46)-N7)-methyltransferase TrmB [Opitutales bacterium]|nr:tRNA (guanosine(46)-N7)-methyltransferase TrmB [Opitutales bacterium]
MEISESHARELARQAERKAELRHALEHELAGVDSILFEAGCGHGHWLASYAEAHPETRCVGIDLISWRIRKCLAKRDKRGLKNLYFHKAELREFLEVLPEPIRIERTVLLFPDPWPKARHHRRRMVQAAFLDEIARRTNPGGQFCFRSDDRPYFDWTIEHLENHKDWRIDASAAWPHETDTYFQGLMDEYFSVIAVRG